MKKDLLTKLHNLFSKNKSKKGLQVILDYVEGRIDINEFKNEFDANKDLKYELSKSMGCEFQFLCNYNYNLYDFFNKSYEYCKKDWNTIQNRSGISGELCRWLKHFNIPFTPFMQYSDDYSFIISIQPSWIDTSDDNILMGIFKEVPKELSRAKQIAWGKARIRELFRFDNTYPRWIQGAEWPIVEGKPLVFSHSEKVKGGEDCMLTRYYFYNPDTSEQTVVEQFT